MYHIIYSEVLMVIVFHNCHYGSYIAKHIGNEDHSNNCKGHLTIPNVSEKFRLHEPYSKWILCMCFKVVYTVHFLYQSTTFITPLNAQS
jgi:hypothetical protein